MEKTTLSRSEKLDRIFGTPVYAVLLAIFCNVLWGSAFPFIKLGYRLFSIDSGNTASILCFAGVRFMLGSFLVLLGSVLLQNRLLPGKPTAENVWEALKAHYDGCAMVSVAELGYDQPMIAANTMAGKDSLQLIVCGGEDRRTLSTGDVGAGVEPQEVHAVQPVRHAVHARVHPSVPAGR